MQYTVGENKALAFESLSFLKVLHALVSKQDQLQQQALIHEYGREQQ